MSQIRIFKDTKKRANEFARYTDAAGNRYAQVPRDLLESIEEPAPPADYSDETYYRTEQDDAPYVVYTPKSPEQIAVTRWEKLKAKRDHLMTNGGAQAAGKWFHSDTHSKVQQLGLMLAGAALPAGIRWKTMDGTFIDMTPDLAQQIYTAQMTQEQAIFAVAEAKKLDNSDINTGWPETYTP